MLGTSRREEAPAPAPAPSRGLGGLGWVGLGLGLRRRRGPHGLRVLTSPAQLGPCLQLPGLTAAQTVDDPRTPLRRWWEGDTAVLLCVLSPPVPGDWGWGGTRSHLREMPSLGSVVMPGAPGPSGGAGEPHTKAAGEVCGSGGLRLPPAHDCTPEGCTGVARTCGLWRSLADTEGHRWCGTECSTSEGRPGGWKVPERAEHFPAPRALEVAELPGEPAVPRSPQTRPHRGVHSGSDLTPTPPASKMFLSKTPHMCVQNDQCNEGVILGPQPGAPPSPQGAPPHQPPTPNPPQGPKGQGGGGGGSSPSSRVGGAGWVKSGVRKKFHGLHTYLDSP